MRLNQIACYPRIFGGIHRRRFHLCYILSCSKTAFFNCHINHRDNGFAVGSIRQPRPNFHHPAYGLGKFHHHYPYFPGNALTSAAKVKSIRSSAS